MGEMSVSATPGHVLATIGLGSCVGLVLLDPLRRATGLAHVVLPASREGGDQQPGKFADLAVPALIKGMSSIGGTRTRLLAVIAGGAQMFSFGSSSSLEVGRRNEEAARDALAKAGIELRASATGGTQGRTLRVYVGSGRVTVRRPGAPEEDLLPGIWGVRP
jgi:chemotaxis protein CheD